MSGARLAVEVVVGLSFLRDLHPLHSHQLAWRTVICHSSVIDPDPHLRTGAPCKDLIGLLNVLLA